MVAETVFFLINQQWKWKKPVKNVMSWVQSSDDTVELIHRIFNCEIAKVNVSKIVY